MSSFSKAKPLNRHNTQHPRLMSQDRLPDCLTSHGSTLGALEWQAVRELDKGRFSDSFDSIHADKAFMAFQYCVVDKFAPDRVL